MKKVIVILGLLAAAVAHASPEYKQFYVVNGKEVSAEVALISSIKGADAYQCKAIETKLNKNKTGINLRAVKKPKSTASN